MFLAITGLIGLAAAGASLGASELPSDLDLTEVRAIPVQHNGRWMPLDTLARDVVWTVTGEERFRDTDPVLMFLGWTFDPGAWMKEPLIRIGNAELRSEIGLSHSQETFSYDELTRHKGLHALTDSLRAGESGKKLDPLQSEVKELEEILLTLQTATLGLAILPIPDPADENARWRSMGWALQSGSPEGAPVARAWLSMREAFLADDPAAFGGAAGELSSALRELPAAYRPSADLIAREIWSNGARLFTRSWQLLASSVLLAAAAIALRKKWLDALVLISLLAGFGLLSYGIWVRGMLAGRLPASNMYESLLFLSWGAGAFAIASLLFVRHRSVLLTASAMGALSLCLADQLPLDHFIRPIPPVLLDTVWMSIHVPIIMISYSVLGLAVLIAHAQVFLLAAAPRRERLAQQVDTAHNLYMHAGALLLFIGIVTGSMWAASSWGRYWGWDSKEVWSLVAFLGYMAIMHVNVSKERVPGWAYAVGALAGVTLVVAMALALDPVTPVKVLIFAATLAAMVFFAVGRGPFAAAVKSILAFWMIITTYVVVNYVLGIGLHSYGFGTGAIARWVLLVAAVDMGFVALCAGWRWLQSRSGLPSIMTRSGVV